MASRSRILQVTYMWLFMVVFMLPHVVVIIGVIPTYCGVHKKIEDSRINHLPLVPPFVSKVAYLFLVIDGKGGEIGKDMKLSLDM
jgi:hypothetical protein